MNLSDELQRLARATDPEFAARRSELLGSFIASRAEHAESLATTLSHLDSLQAMIGTPVDRVREAIPLLEENLRKLCTLRDAICREMHQASQTAEISCALAARLEQIAGLETPSHSGQCSSSSRESS